MNSFFPIVKRKDEACTVKKNAVGEVVKPGRYITKDTILALYDELAEGTTTGKPFTSPLNPPPGDIRACHSPRENS